MVLSQVKVQQDASSGNLVYYRLITLWILCEAMLGGIIHAASEAVTAIGICKSL